MEIECSIYVSQTVKIYSNPKSQISFHFFIGEIKALKGLWFIGDDAVTDSYHVFPAMKNEAVLAKRRIPYVFEFYNVSCFTTNLLSEMKDVLARLVNSFVKALNENVYLPRLVVVIPEDDLLHFIDHFCSGISLISSVAINWIVNQMERAVEAIKDYLQRQCLGAIAPNEPKFIWVKAISKGFRKTESTVKYKYNPEMEEALTNQRNHYIMSLQRSFNSTHFNSRGKFTASGNVRFWDEINKLLESFDRQKVSLKPLSKSQLMPTKPSQ